MNIGKRTGCKVHIIILGKKCTCFTMFGVINSPRIQMSHYTWLALWYDCAGFGWPCDTELVRQFYNVLQKIKLLYLCFALLTCFEQKPQSII